MDPRSVATIAVAALAPYLSKVGEAFAKEIGKQLPKEINELYNAIKGKFRGDSYAEQTLKRAVDDPQSPSRLNTLIDILTEKLEEDVDFANRISRIVRSAQHSNSGNTSQLISIAGTVKGDVLQIGEIKGTMLIKKIKD